MLRIDGRNILDDGFSGPNVRNMESGRFDKEGAANLVSGIRMGMGQGIDLPGNDSNLIGKTSAIIAESIGKNTQELQKLLLDQDDGTKEKINDIVKALSDSQEKNGKELLRAVESITEKIEELRLESGEDGDKMIELLGLDKAKDSLNNFTPSSHPLADRFNRYIGASSGQSAMSGLAQIARQPSLLLGFRPRAGTSVEDRVRANFIRRRQNQSINDTLGALSPTEAGELGGTPAMTPGSTFTTGIDRDPSKIEKTLVEMKKLLQQIADCGCPDNSGILDSLKMLTTIVGAIGVGVGAFALKSLQTSMGDAYDSIKDRISILIPEDVKEKQPEDVEEKQPFVGPLQLPQTEEEQTQNPVDEPVRLPDPVDVPTNVPDPIPVAARALGEQFDTANPRPRSGHQLRNWRIKRERFINEGLVAQGLVEPAPQQAPLPNRIADFAFGTPEDPSMFTKGMESGAIPAAVVAGAIVLLASSGVGLPTIPALLATLGLGSLSMAAGAEEIDSMPLNTSDAIQNMTPTDRQALQQVIQNIDNSQQILQNAGGGGGRPTPLRQRPDRNSQERYQDSRTSRAYGQGGRD